MYILIDTEEMKLLHKHTLVEVISNLAWIECQSTSYAIFPVDDAMGFRSFTDTELGIIYRNITGDDHNKLGRKVLLQVIHDLIAACPETEVTLIGLERQAEYVKEGDPRPWVYAKGATRPALLAELFDRPGIKSPSDPESEKRAIAGELPALTRATPPPVSAPVAKREPAAVRVAANSSKAIKRGTAKSLIWEVADRLWGEQGKPTDKADVLKVRKIIMDELEKEGIRRTSASSELAIWHKDRAPY